MEPRPLSFNCHHCTWWGLKGCSRSHFPASLFDSVVYGCCTHSLQPSSCASLMEAARAISLVTMASHARPVHARSVHPTLFLSDLTSQQCWQVDLSCLLETLTPWLQSSDFLGFLPTSLAEGAGFASHLSPHALSLSLIQARSLIPSVGH